MGFAEVVRGGEQDTCSLEICKVTWAVIDEVVCGDDLFVAAEDEVFRV